MSGGRGVRRGTAPPWRAPRGGGYQPKPSGVPRPAPPPGPGAGSPEPVSEALAPVLAAYVETLRAAAAAEAGERS